jgi:DNA-binding transcriptional ArsR family regulator
MSVKHRETSVKRLAEVMKLLAEPNRVRILLSLGLQCRPVTDVIQATGLAQTNVSFHLRALREAGLVRAERRGSFIYYCLPDPELLNILGHLNVWLETRMTPEAANGRARVRQPEFEAVSARHQSARRTRPNA